MKRNLFYIFLSIFSLSFVSAIDPFNGILRGLDVLITWIRNIADMLLNYISIILFDSYFHGDLIYTKMLLFFLLLIAVYLTLSKNQILSPNKSLNFIIGLIVSILAVRFLPDDLINGIRIPYGSLAVAILVFIPLLIFFFWIHGNAHITSFGRRIGWVIYGAAFLSIWYNDPNKIPITDTIYWIGLGFVALSLIFDTKVHEWLGLSDYRHATNQSRQELRNRLRLLLNEMYVDLQKYEAAGMTKAADDMRKRIENMEKRVRKTFK